MSKNSNLFSVNPNPASAELNVFVSELWSSEDLEFIVFDLMGNVVLKKDIGQVVNARFQVDVSHFPVGNYFIQPKTSEEQQTKRFTVLH